MTSGFQQQPSSLSDYAPRRTVPAQQHGARFADLASPPAKTAGPRGSQTKS